ncbi:ribose transport system ATP-binding protein [Cohaesibacter sp. ES.047]|nr:ribose transport system ATP-binding protein [Cohaesibacter sp. ES.047]
MYARAVEPSGGNGSGAFIVMIPPRLRLENVTKSFGPVEVLHGVNLSIAPGEVVGLLGENGAGKSTLMNVVSGRLSADTGEIELDGAVLKLASIKEGMGLGIRFVHQELSTIGSLSVAENIFLGDYLAGKSGVIRHSLLVEKARKVLASVGLEDLDPSASVDTLSPGQQQLIEIAKAIVVKPSLLILDEPTSSLTSFEADKLFRLVRDLTGEGVSVVFITHKLDEAISNCDRIVVLRDGKLVSSELASETSKQKLIVHMIGKSSEFNWRGSAARVGETRVSIRNLQDETVLSPIDLDIDAGEVVALFGLVGAGRTEFMETLFGFRKAKNGTLKIDNETCPLGHVPTAVRYGLAMVPEGRKVRGILPSHSVERNISISNLSALTRLGVVRQGEERRGADFLSKSLHIRMEDGRQEITSLSGGNQQKAVFARAVMIKPRLLLLDEPSHGVDVGAKAEIYQIISDLAREGMSVLVASSELPEVFALADRCVVFSCGELVGSLARDEMTEEKILQLAFSRH